MKNKLITAGALFLSSCVSQPVVNNENKLVTNDANQSNSCEVISRKFTRKFIETVNKQQKEALFDQDNKIEDVIEVLKQSCFAPLETIRRANCPNIYINDVERSISQLIAKIADEALNSKRLSIKDVKGLLSLAPITTWETQVIYGEIAIIEKNGNLAQQFFKTALELTTGSDNQNKIYESLLKAQNM